MSKILVITDQPIYTHSASFIAGSSIYLHSIFAGDIINGVFSELQHVSSMGYDSLLYPSTLDNQVTGHEKVVAFVDTLRKDNPQLKVHLYSNQY